MNLGRHDKRWRQRLSVLVRSNFRNVPVSSSQALRSLTWCQCYRFIFPKLSVCSYIIIKSFYEMKLGSRNHISRYECDRPLPQIFFLYSFMLVFSKDFPFLEPRISDGFQNSTSRRTVQFQAPIITYILFPNSCFMNHQGIWSHSNHSNNFI